VVLSSGVTWPEGRFESLGSLAVRREPQVRSHAGSLDHPSAPLYSLTLAPHHHTATRLTLHQ